MTNFRDQLQLDLFPRSKADQCKHDNCFITDAYVPSGLCCFECGTLVLQFIPGPPEVLGYLSADWAWHLKGNPWTTQETQAA